MFRIAPFWWFFKTFLFLLRITILSFCHFIILFIYYNISHSFLFELGWTSFQNVYLFGNWKRQQNFCIILARNIRILDTSQYSSHFLTCHMISDTIYPELFVRVAIYLGTWKSCFELTKMFFQICAGKNITVLFQLTRT